MSSTETTKRRRVSQKAERFTESVIREMTREAMKHGAVAEIDIIGMHQPMGDIEF